MQVKTFAASDIQEALRLVKQEMGPGAVIISTRHLRRGGSPFGIFGSSRVEITAALPDGESADGGSGTPSKFPLLPGLQEDVVRLSDGGHRQTEIPDAGSEGGRGALTRGAPTMPTLCQTGEMLRRSVEDLRDVIEARQPSGAGEAVGGLEELRWEMEELRWTVNAMMERLDPLKGKNIPEEVSKLYKRLRLQGVRQDLAFMLLESVKEALDNREIRKPMTLEKFLAGKMESMMPPPAQPPQENGRKVIFLMGPAGSGKTTTLAKMAADAALKSRKDVALFSMDTYRIGAVEQLRIYAKIIGIPLAVAGSGADLRRGVEARENADVIFVDTPAFGVGESESLTLLRDQLKGIRGLETHLVLNATGKDRDLWDSIRMFWPVPIHGLIFTRLDETREYGTIFNQAVRSRKPLTYFSTGQKVPEDLERANPGRLARMVLFNKPKQAA